MASKQNKQDDEQQPTPRPLRSTLAAFGVGLAWAATHMPSTLGHGADVVTWLVRALVAAFITKAVLDVATALLAWLVKLVTEHLRRMRK